MNLLLIKLMIMLPRMLDRIFEEYDLSMEEFAKDPYGFIDKLEDEYLKVGLWMAMELMD